MEIIINKNNIQMDYTESQIVYFINKKEVTCKINFIKKE